MHDRTELLEPVARFAALVIDFVDGKIITAKIKADYGIDIEQTAAATR